MGWHNPPLPWSEFERTLSGRTAPEMIGDGNDSPAWTRRRYDMPRESRLRLDDGTADGSSGNRVPYAELHCHSNFSFLDGASHPEELAATAAELGLEAVALTDHNGMYGAVRFAEAAKQVGIRTVFGTELGFDLAGTARGEPDPAGEHLVLLARDVDGYRALCRAVTDGYGMDDDRDAARAEKGKPVHEIHHVAELVRGRAAVLTGCRKGRVRRALHDHGPAAAERELRELVSLFGSGNVFVELTDSGFPEDGERNDALAGIAARVGLDVVATTAAHHATPERGRVAAALAAVRARRDLDAMDGWLPPAGAGHLRSGTEMARLFRHYPHAVTRAALLGVECAFELDLVSPRLPDFPVPAGYSEPGFLRELVRDGVVKRYGSLSENPRALTQIEHELAVIEKLGFPGYFLIVWDIVRFCREQGILCQGRGSAANSAVCFALGITKVDAVRWNLLFERFLAPERDGYPDIDIDIESDRREEAIQYVYRRYGRRCSAQVANVITYRPKLAVRDMAKALGYAQGQQDAWSKQIDRWGPLRDIAHEEGDEIPGQVIDLACAIENFPRHLGIHSGGMVICDRPVSEVVPVEWARMADRSVLQWDKDDCAEVGLVKFDLLGLGMLSALRYAIELTSEHEGLNVDLGELDLSDGNVYEMLCRADSVGVFQVESRAQMATLPRLKPRTFYDLVVEVALIRPGPIQGGSVHPYIRRHNGDEEATVEHPLLENALGKTLGVPLFQEQLMQLAIDVAGFSPSDADELRRAMGSKRSGEKMERLKKRLFSGMRGNGIDDDLGERIYTKLLAFSDFGFPESHAHSFAHLVFGSAWFKRYHPAEFYAGLLRAQPMGFYSPQSLVADARRHGVVTHGADINASLAHTGCEPDHASTGGLAVRLGLGMVRTIGENLAAELATERRSGGPYASIEDVARRVPLSNAQAEALATAGAFDCFGTGRREALWSSGAAAAAGAGTLPGTMAGGQAPTLPGMSEVETAAADVWALGLSPGSFPTQFARQQLDALGALPASSLADVTPGSRVLVGGAVTHRQRPATAGGVTFLNIEDETGMVNVVCSQGLWARYRKPARSSPALLVRGTVEQAEGVVSLVADRLQHLQLHLPSTSRDFR